MADDVGHLVAAVGIGVPRAGLKTTVSWASGLPLSAGQEARMAGEDLEALLPRAIDVRSE